ncbi:MAG: metallophosphoesterase family protein [archaeon]
MKYMIFSDIHGNLPAFQEVKKNVAGKRFDLKICLGDSVGYYPFPNEVLREVKGFADVILPGNHDMVVYEIAHRIRNNSRAEPSHEESMFRPAAREAASWIAHNLTDESFSMLEGIVNNKLPDKFSVQEGNLLFAHSTPKYPEDMDYIKNVGDAYEHFFSLSEFRGMTAFVGHTHEPQFYAEPKEDLGYSHPLGGRIKIIEDIGRGAPSAKPKMINTPETAWEKAQEEMMNKLTVRHNLSRPVEIKLDTSAYVRSLAVVPGLGQPRDGLNFTGYATYDTETKELCFVRIPYDTKPVLDRTRQIEALARQANRLVHGI